MSSWMTWRLEGEDEQGDRGISPRILTGLKMGSRNPLCDIVIQLPKDLLILV